MKLKRAILSGLIVCLLTEMLSVLSLKNAAALLLAVLVHEFGHFTAIVLLGMKVASIHLEPGGLLMDYAGVNSGAKEILIAAAGPICGVIYSVGIYLYVLSSDSWLNVSSEFSIIYSLFNLLPILPLDGGRIFACISSVLLGDEQGGAVSYFVSLAFSLLVLATGLGFCIKGEGNGLLAAGMWLMLLQNRN